VGLKFLWVDAGGIFVDFFNFFLIVLKSMPKKNAAPAARIPTKDSFFLSKRTMVESKKPELPVDVPKAAPVRQRRFLFEQGTGMAYAEVLGDAAICLETGQELFRFGGGDDVGEYQPSSGFQRPFDFSPPDGKRHPADRFVDVLNLVKAGILAEEDVANQKAFTSEELVCAMDRLENYRREMERMCESV
jgi:hypothetical protein